MPPTETLGRLLLIGGALLAVVGLVVLVAGRAGLSLGGLPGDITWRRGSVTVFAPVVSCLVLSVVLTLLANLALWLLRR